MGSKSIERLVALMGECGEGFENGHDRRHLIGVIHFVTVPPSAERCVLTVQWT